MLKGFTRNFEPLEILTGEQVEAIHRGALDVLETTGVRVEHDRALKFFADHACKVDFDEKRVRIPGWLVEDCLRKCPSSFTVKARDPKYDLRIGMNTLCFCQSAGMRYVDLNTWETRPGTLKEHGDAIRVCDALDTVHMLLGFEFYMDMERVPPCMMAVEGVASGIRNSAKTENVGSVLDCEIFAIEMANAMGMALMGGVNTSAPLTLYEDVCEAAFRFAEAGFPMNVATAPIMGGTGPATIAGSAVTSNAELLAGLVLGELIRPGIGILAELAVWPMDMKRGTPAFGAVGLALNTLALNQIWRKYGIPTVNNPSFSNSKRIDFQAGYERSMTTLAGALSGGNMMFLHGATHGELAYHPVMSILDDDLAGWVGRLIEGVEVNDETLAIDLIEEVGPIPGHYLGREHTRKWWKKEQFVPKVADRLTYPEWMKAGRKSCLDYAKERMEDILATHKPTALTASQEEDIERILGEARKYYREKGMISDAEWAEYMREVESPNYPYT